VSAMIDQSIYLLGRISLSWENFSGYEFLWL
jgi:hypothetical protein